MRLRQFQVRGFRCIRDSGAVPVGDVAALIGKNENGKTTLLQALTHLNKDKPIRELDKCDEMWAEFEANPGLRIVEGTFELSEMETTTLTDHVPSAPRITTLHMFRALEGPVQYEFLGVEFGTRLDVDAAANTAFQKEVSTLQAAFEALSPAEATVEQVKPLYAVLGTPEKQGQAAIRATVENLTGLLGQLPQLEAPVKKLNAAAAKLFRTVQVRPQVEAFIREKLHPRFVYFSEYKQINGAIKIPQYLAESTVKEDQQLDTGEPLDKRETINNLFYLAGLDPKKLEQIKNSPAMKNKYLLECGSRLTKALRPTWITQPVDVELVYDNDVLWVKIADIHEAGKRTNIGPLSRRASGFIWHFSFFVNFTAETQKAELKDAILLLDEPGLHLHPAQQAGTVEVFRGLAKNNQIIYTTHSPFMIFDYRVGNLLTVELDRTTHLSSIRSLYWDSDPQTLMPILHALGTPEAFASATSGLSRRTTVVMEGITDYYYLTAILDLLILRDKKPPSEVLRANLLQANGSAAIGPLALYRRKRGCEVVVLYDREPGALQQADNLRKLGFPQEKICYCRVGNKEECDIEDLFTEAEFLAAVNKTYGEILKDSKFIPVTGEMIAIKKKTEPTLIRIVPILESIWQDRTDSDWGSFDKKKVCERLCEIIYDKPDSVENKTVGRFEELFKSIANAIRPPVIEASSEPEKQAASPKQKT